MLDESGGKPLSGYGSGANSGSPVATPQESAAMLVATAETLKTDFNSMCRDGGEYAFEGDFCQTLATESRAARKQAVVLAQDPSLAPAVPWVLGAVGGGLTAKVAVKYGPKAVPVVIVAVRAAGQTASRVAGRAARELSRYSPQDVADCFLEATSVGRGVGQALFAFATCLRARAARG